MKKNEVYKCEICGNVVELLTVGGGELFCCGQPMNKQDENTMDASKEKHIPTIKQNGNEIIVTVGETEHPMTEDHYIEWIEVITNQNIYRKYLSPDDKPSATFTINEKIIKIRAYCNIHGLWKN